MSESIKKFLEANPGKVPDGTPKVVSEPYRPGVPVTTGTIDKKVRALYSGNQDLALAAAIHEATGWPVVANVSGCVDGDSCSEVLDSEDRCSCRYGHVGVRRSDGKIVDVRGASKPVRFVADSNDPVDSQIVDVPDDRLDRMLFRDQKWGREDLAIARSFVGPVLSVAGGH